MDSGQVNGQNMPEQGELVWFRRGDGTWDPAIWITPPGASHWRYATVMMRGDVYSTCHYSRFRRGEEMPNEGW